MRALKGVVAALGALCLGAFGVLVWLVFAGARTERATIPPSSSAPAAPRWAELDLGLPAGSRVLSMQAAGETLALHLRLPDGAERVVIVDPRAGTLLGRIKPGEP
jgi:hypothetical protein